MKGIKRTVDLGPARLHVQWADEKAMRAEAECEADEEAPDGLWDGEATIYLHTRLRATPRRARQILLHELIHACCDLYHEVS